MILHHNSAAIPSQVLKVVVASHTRAFAVLAWGRNVEGQCGVEGLVPVVTRPTAILDLHQAACSSVLAGKLDSAAVVGEDVYTWGDGAAGKLGLGNGESVISPSRVEAFIGRSPIRAASLGHHHTLFLDQAGCLWACGENKEGQCGLGTPLEVLASQHRRAYHEAMRPLASVIAQNHHDRFSQYLRAAASSSADQGSSAAAEAVPYIAHGWGSLGSSSSSNGQSRHGLAHQQQHAQAAGSSWGWGRGQVGGGFVAGAAADFDAQFTGSSSGGGWGFAASGAAGGLFGSSHSSVSDTGSSGLWGCIDLETHLNATGINPGQMATPARVGTGQSSSALLGLGHEGSSSSGRGLAATAVDEGLGSEVVVGMSASKYFSLAVTEKGAVWAFGADYNGALGSEASWLSSARRVAAPISRALAAAGGAAAVAAGGTFAAALTARGSVLVWGKLAGGSPATPGLTAAAAPPAAAAPGSLGVLPGGGVCDDGRAASSVAAAEDRSSSDEHSGAGTMFAEVVLPAGVAIRSIAAGQQHLLMSDGQHVWLIGRWVDAAGEEVGVASWASPHQVLALPAKQGAITKVVAGMHSSAAVTLDGRLWLWGRLLDEHHGLGILRRFGGNKHAVGVDWGWSGFGGAAPRLVEEVVGVRDVALGGWHALALVD